MFDTFMLAVVESIHEGAACLLLNLHDLLNISHRHGGWFLAEHMFASSECRNRQRLVAKVGCADEHRFDIWMLDDRQIGINWCDIQRWCNGVRIVGGEDGSMATLSDRLGSNLPHLAESNDATAYEFGSLR